MKLLNYLEPMKTLPNRFSNLAFWRIMRVFKDKVVDAFTYVNTWGNGIENEQKTQNATLTTHGQMLNTLAPLVFNSNKDDFITSTYLVTYTITKIKDYWYLFKPNEYFVTIDKVPHHIQVQGNIRRYNDDDSKTQETLTIDVPFRAILDSGDGKFKIALDKFELSTPYPLEMPTGMSVYVYYTSHR